MPNYKDGNNQVHFLENPDDAAKYLPAGCVEITDAEAEAILNPPLTSAQMKAAVQAEINLLEDQSKIPRITREFMLGSFLKDALAAGYTEAQIIAANIGYSRLKALDEQIRALREQL